jgi:hypothetical protein
LRGEKYYYSISFFKTKGELNAEKKDKYDQAVVAFKKLVENVEVMAELLSEQMPDLPIDGNGRFIVFFPFYRFNISIIRNLPICFLKLLL